MDNAAASADDTAAADTAPMVGHEWMTTRGNLLLRVGAHLSQAAATQYTDAFMRLP